MITQRNKTFAKESVLLVRLNEELHDVKKQLIGSSYSSMKRNNVDHSTISPADLASTKSSSSLQNTELVLILGEKGTCHESVS